MGSGSCSSHGGGFSNGFLASQPLYSCETKHRSCNAGLAWAATLPEVSSCLCGRGPRFRSARRVAKRFPPSLWLNGQKGDWGGLEGGRPEGRAVLRALSPFRCLCLAREQARLKTRMVARDTEAWQRDPTFSGLRRVGGLDVSFVNGESSRACASLVVLSYPQLKVIALVGCATKGTGSRDSDQSLGAVL